MALIPMLFCASNAAYAQAQQSGRTMIAVVTPTTLVKRADLDMGSMLPGGGGVVSVNVDGTRGTTGSVLLIGTDFHPARFAGQGAVLQRIQIRLPTVITITNPVGNTMAVSNFRFGPDPTLPVSYLRLGNSPNIRLLGLNGVFGFIVGADLTVAANQPGGIYSGNFDVTVNYQ